MGRIVLVDDDALVLAALKQALNLRGVCADWFTDGGEALLDIERDVPDGVILDWRMPSMPGDVLIHRVRARYPHLACLVLTGELGRDNVDSAFAAGADDVAYKPVCVDELLARFKHALRSRGARQVIRVANLEIDPCARLATLKLADGSHLRLDLTRVEFDLLVSLARRSHMTVPIPVLLDEAWGVSRCVQPHAVVEAVRRLRRKLGSAKGLLVHVAGAGYRLGNRTSPARYNATADHR